VKRLEPLAPWVLAALLLSAWEAACRLSGRLPQRAVRAYSNIAGR